MLRTCCDCCTCCCGSIKVNPETIPDVLPKQVRVINEFDLLHNRLELLRETSISIHKSIKEQSEKRKLERINEVGVSSDSYDTEESKTRKKYN
jgi:hypothetical protein